MASPGIELLLFAALIPIIAKRVDMPLSDIGFHPGVTLKEVASALGAAVLCYPLASICNLVSKHDMNTGLTVILKGFERNDLNMAGAFWGLGIMGPIEEEIVFRGGLLSLLCAYWGKTPVKKALFAVASSLAFAFVHQTGHPIDYAVFFLSGMIWSGLFFVTGSLKAAIISHCIYNIFAGFII